ncbi:MAG: hypothetical protein FJX62_13525 [Alphaproteobacteria bacterium]|nr:hypothetical protein [Alphaproteobacteria bacterium]
MTAIEILEPNAGHRPDRIASESASRLEGPEAVALYCDRITQNLNLLRSAAMEMDAMLLEFKSSA